MTANAESLRVTAPPHVRLAAHRRQFERTLLVGALPVMAASVWLHGTSALQLYAVAGAAAVAADWLGHVLRRASPGVRVAHALVIGLLVVMMSAPTVHVVAAGVGAGCAALVARILRDRWETYVWHPALTGWLLALLLSPQLHRPADTSPDLPRPVDQIAQVYGPEARDGARRLRELALYHLPSWENTLSGKVPGGLGETCGLAILVGGLWLVYVGNLRWQLPVCAVAAAVMLAALWPIRGPDGEWMWFPIMLRVDGLPVGMVLVLYHVTGGGLLLAAIMHGADTISTPLNERGHAVFGAGLGAFTVGLRALGIPIGACWFALLAMNLAAPLIDRVTRRRAWGT